MEEINKIRPNQSPPRSSLTKEGMEQGRLEPFLWTPDLAPFGVVAKDLLPAEGPVRGPSYLAIRVWGGLAFAPS